ncbi:MAG TPA: hypothetical protein VEZ71_05425, partial [Archangium sp.]|nr:hypothetical protein [Archangium sp.]
MKKHWLLMAAAVASLSGCYNVDSNSSQSVSSFRVVVQSISAVSAGGSLQPLDVLPSCTGARGTKDCRYAIPGGQVELLLDVTALDKTGKPFDFNGPVTFK